jgi:chemotaxis protein MotB
MSRRKKHAPHENHERWLVSYADFLTLLFAFFVVMFATAQSDKGKAAQISEAVKEALKGDRAVAAVAAILGGSADDRGKGGAARKGAGGSQVPPRSTSEGQEQLASLEPLWKELTATLQEEIGQSDIRISLEPRGLVISLQEKAFFPSGEDTINPGTFGALQKIAENIRDMPHPVRLEGHTDSVPIHTVRFRSNWELSAARSIAVLNLFAQAHNLPRQRLSIVGYAETAPVETNTTPEGRARNRRVDIVVLTSGGMGGEPTRAASAPPPPASAAKPAPVPASQPSARSLARDIRAPADDRTARATPEPPAAVPIRRTSN